MSRTKTYDLVIIGAGPAGLSAALYCARAGLKVAVIEKYWPGGKLNKTLSIENYPGYVEINGPQLGEYMFKQVKELEVDSYTGDVTDISNRNGKWVLNTADKQKLRGKTVLIASGMKEKTLDIPNVKEYYGKGVSYCAICDGNLYTNSKVIVVGGGDSAVEESLYLANITKGVELVHRRREYRASDIFVKRMKKHKNIREHNPYIPVAVKVKQDKVVGLNVQHVETGKTKLIKGECVFFYIGLSPECYFINKLNLELDNLGFIRTNEKMETSVPGIFAAGDVIHKELRQVVTAVNDGAVAAISIKNYLENISS